MKAIVLYGGIKTEQDMITLQCLLINLSHGRHLLQAGSFGLSKQSESLIQYSMRKWLIWKSCAFTISGINYCLQILLPRAVADPILRYLTEKIAKHHGLSLPLVIMTEHTKTFTTEAMTKLVSSSQYLYIEHYINSGD